MSCFIPDSARIGRFARHYLEMVIAMFAGMLVLGLAAAGALELVGTSLSELEETAPGVYLLAMGVAMTVPMAAWMRYRGHGWRPTCEMAGAMMVPTIAVVVLLVAGITDFGAAMMIEHVAMFPAMLAVMLARWDEFSAPHDHPQPMSAKANLAEASVQRKRPDRVNPDRGRIAMNTPPIVSLEEWEETRLRLRVKEKELTRARDALAAERRRMPWQAVDKDYRFEGPDGPARLLDLFESRRQLVLYRAFYEPGVHGWPAHGCVGCSFMADHVPNLAHLNARNTTLAYASRAPQPVIERLKASMGWEHIPWYTITDDFDADFGVDEWHGTNVFIRDGDRIFRTYFTNGRGDEVAASTWTYLDMTALGRQEEWEDSPEGYPQTPPYVWWRWHDDYGTELSEGQREQISRAPDAEGSFD